VSTEAGQLQSDGRSVKLAHPQVARADNPTAPFQPRAPSKQSTVQALKNVSLTRRSGIPLRSPNLRPVRQLPSTVRS
jgi:hypothetical protein